MVQAEDFHGSSEPGQHAHGAQRAGNVHPGVLGGRRIDTHGPYLESKRRLVEQPGDQDDRREGDEETRVQARGRAKVRQGGGRQNGRVRSRLAVGSRSTCLTR